MHEDGVEVRLSRRSYFEIPPRGVQGGRGNGDQYDRSIGPSPRFHCPGGQTGNGEEGVDTPLIQAAPGLPVDRRQASADIRQGFFLREQSAEMDDSPGQQGFQCSQRDPAFRPGRQVQGPHPQVPVVQQTVVAGNVNQLPLPLLGGPLQRFHPLRSQGIHPI